jgi:hypothetical protein
MKKWNPLVSISNIPKKRRVNPLWLKFNPFTVTAFEGSPQARIACGENTLFSSVKPLSFCNSSHDDHRSNRLQEIRSRATGMNRVPNIMGINQNFG